MDLNFDVKEKVEELASKFQQDPALLKNFQDDPVKTLEKLLGIDLPDDQLNQRRRQYPEGPTPQSGNFAP